jgi:hypothetical protein
MQQFPSFNNFNASTGSISWETNFTLTTTINSIFQITFTVSSPDNTSFSEQQTVSLTCTGTSCVSNLGASFYTDSDHSITLPLFDLTGCNCNDLTFGETVNWQAGVPTGNPQTQILDFKDPMTLTMFDSNGNVVPNLILYNSTSNDFIGLSGQDFLGSGVPEPSTWAMMLLGFCGLGFAFKQSRRKVLLA